MPPRSIVIYRREGLTKFGARHDAEFWVNAVQVSANRSVGQEQPVRDLSIGKAFKGRSTTAFSNQEETQASFAGNAPWLLEDRLRLAGANYVGEAGVDAARRH